MLERVEGRLVARLAGSESRTEGRKVVGFGVEVVRVEERTAGSLEPKLEGGSGGGPLLGGITSCSSWSKGRRSLLARQKGQHSSKGAARVCRGEEDAHLKTHGSTDASARAVSPGRADQA